MNLLTNPMFIADCTVTGIFLRLLWLVHLYMVETKAHSSVVPKHSLASRHVRAHFHIAAAMFVGVASFTAVKAVHTVLQVGDNAVSPLEMASNASLIVLGISLMMTVYHLRHEEDPEHKFYSMWHGDANEQS